MPGRPYRRLLPCCAALLALAGGLRAAEPQESEQYLKAKAELEAMVAKWDQGLFELTFEPGTIDRVTLTDRLGETRIFHYLTFRLRNQVTVGGVTPISQAKGYNEVLAAVAKQYDQAKVASEQGVALTVDGVQGRDGVIVERQDALVRTRAVSIGVLAYDERGSRIHLLGEKGSDPADAFAFRDLGNPITSTVVDAVRERVEEIQGRRLLTPDEIRGRELPPYDAAKRTEEGWAVGELHGVVIFDRLSDFGRKFTLEVRGLSNKFRIHWPEAERGKVENYLESRFQRRAFVLHYALLGDEYFRDRDRFELVKAGWEWLPTFQRNDKRRTMAYSRYFLENITTDKADSVNSETATRFWNWYDEQRKAQEVREKVPQLPDLKAEIAK